MVLNKLLLVFIAIFCFRDLSAKIRIKNQNYNLNHSENFKIAFLKFKSMLACGDSIANSGSHYNSYSHKCLKSFFLENENYYYLLKVLVWLQVDKEITSFRECNIDESDIVEIIKDNSKEIYFCIEVKLKNNNSTSYGFVGFVKQNLDLKISKIKI